MLAKLISAQVFNKTAQEGFFFRKLDKRRCTIIRDLRVLARNNHFLELVTISSGTFAIFSNLDIFLLFVCVSTMVFRWFFQCEIKR